MKKLQILAIGLMAFAGSAVHAATLDFGVIAPTPGSINYAGGAAPLVGTGIEVDNLVGLDTPLNSNVELTCIRCALDFTTGANTSPMTWAGGGSIAVTGALFDGGTEVVGPTTLLSGSFLSAQVFDVGGGILEFRILGASFEDRKDPTMLAFYGMPEVPYLGGMNLSFTAALNDNGGFDSVRVLSGDIINNPVPVPAAVWLFGSGLLGLVAVARRRA